MDDVYTIESVTAPSAATTAVATTTAVASKPPCRVVVHLDLDCFYAQVEQRRLQIPAGEPVAVQQWGSLLAVNYAARKCGVLRGEHTSDALKKCPNIHLPHVDTLGENRRPNEAFDRKHQKAILRRYRLASREIFDVLRRLAPLCEKAGVDEAFLDLTLQAQQRLAAMDATSTDFCFDPRNAATKVFGISQMDGLGKDAAREPDANFPVTLEEQLLAVGAVVATEIRDAVRTELQFTCSTGIATNKLLAKLASPLNKPDGQTLIAPRFVPLLMQHFPLRKVRGLGGKLGKQLESLLPQHEVPASAPAPTLVPGATKAETPATAVTDDTSSTITVATFVETLGFDALVKHLGRDTALFVSQVCAGDDGDDPVNNKKTDIKTLSSVKQFDQRTGDALVRLEQLAYWVRVLSEEIVLRLEDERAESKRFPLQLAVSSTRNNERPRTHRLRIAQTTTVDELCAAALAVLKRDGDSVFPCAMLSMHAKDFVAVDSASASSITSFFTKQPDDNVAPADTVVDAEHPAESELKRFAATIQRRSEATAKKRASISSFFQAAAPAPAKMVDTLTPMTTTASATELASSTVIDNVESDVSVAGDISSDLFKVVSMNETVETADLESRHGDAFAQFRVSSKNGNSSTARGASFYCERCLRQVAESRAEHADFHFAVDLSRRESSAQSATVPSTSASRASAMGSNSSSKKRKATGPLDAFLKR